MKGHFAHDAWLVNNRFVGKMNGCVCSVVADSGKPIMIKGNALPRLHSRRTSAIVSTSRSTTSSGQMTAFR
jgi:hypothetical protein